MARAQKSHRVRGAAGGSSGLILSTSLIAEIPEAYGSMRCKLRDAGRNPVHLGLAQMLMDGKGEDASRLVLRHGKRAGTIAEFARGGLQVDGDRVMDLRLDSARRQGGL